jgi:hypothetical protein
MQREPRVPAFERQSLDTRNPLLARQATVDLKGQARKAANIAPSGCHTIDPLIRAELMAANDELCSRSRLLVTPQDAAAIVEAAIVAMRRK